MVGVLAAAAAFFVAFYPNIASLPVPTPLSQIHLGLLPTWNWGFQFGVNLDEANRNPIDWLSVAILTSCAVAGLCRRGGLLPCATGHAMRSEREDESVSPLPETS